MDREGIELSHLRYFLALADELHFGRAAARLHLSQPPLTRHIQTLESRLGCRLFERTSRATELTPAGALLRDRAREIVREAEDLFSAVQSAGKGEEGQLVVSTAPSLLLGELPDVIRTFRTQYPRVAFRLGEAASSATLQAVGGGAADIGLVRGRDRTRNVCAQWTWSEEMAALLPADHRLAGEKELSLPQLAGEALVFFPRHLGPSFYDEIGGHCERAGFALRAAQEARQWSSIISLVRAGMGVSICPFPMAEWMPRGVSCVRLPGVETTARVVIRPGAERNPVIANFLDTAHSVYASKGAAAVNRERGRKGR